MNKTDIAAANRALLAHWLDLLLAAQRKQDSETEALRKDSKGAPYQSAPLTIPAPSTDMMRLLLGGIQAALDDKSDPFGIQPPARGIAPRFNRQGQIDAVVKVLEAIARHETEGTRNAVSEAIREVATAVAWSESALRKAYDDADLRGWAELQLAQRKQYDA